MTSRLSVSWGVYVMRLCIWQAFDGIGILLKLCAGFEEHKG